VGILVRKDRGHLSEIGGWGTRLVWGTWKKPGGEDLVVSSCYVPAVSRERVDWIAGLLEEGVLDGIGIDILGGDFNMVRDVVLDRTDNGARQPGQSAGWLRWKEVERAQLWIDAGREMWGRRHVYTHWTDGLGTRIDWILTADCWGRDVWKDLDTIWCPWSDHWGLLGKARMGGKGDGPGHWCLNTALLEDPYLWKRWAEEICGSVACWKGEGSPIEVRWLALKAAAQRFWIDAGKQRSLQRRNRNQRASKRLAVLLQSMGEVAGNKNDIDW
jgi:hypothetical protein